MTARPLVSPIARIAPAALLVVGLAAACGDDKREPSQKPADVPTATAASPTAAEPVALPSLGVTRPTDLAYDGGKGARAFGRAEAAARKQDWTQARAACEEALAADPLHLDAHRLLASALAQQGEYEDALEHLAIALAGDFGRWGAAAAKDPLLERIASSPLGSRLEGMVAVYRDQFVRAARGGLHVVARRAAFKEPARPKKAGAPHRLTRGAEVFAYQLDTRRYVRLTRTSFQVLGFLLSPSGDELAYVTASGLRPGQPPGPDGAGSPPVLAGIQIGVVSLAAPDAPTTPAALKSARTLVLEYLPGDELVATAHDPEGWWELGEAHAFSIDRTSGKATPTATPGRVDDGGPPPPAPRPAHDAGTGPTSADPTAVSSERRLVVRYETVELESPGDTQGVAADWNPENGTVEEFVIEASRKRVHLPPGEQARRDSLTWSPDRARLAFATAADPCAEQPLDRQSAFYVVDVESGRLRHLVRGSARLRPRFADPVTVAFEDEQGTIHLYDAAVAREVGRLENRPGQSFVGLGAMPGVPCLRAPPAPPSACDPADSAAAPSLEPPPGTATPPPAPP